MMHVIMYICKNQYKTGQKDAYYHSRKKGDLSLTTNYRVITLTAIAANVFNVMLLN